MAWSLKRIQEELRRRSIWQVVVAYAVGVVGVLGVVDLAGDLIGLPDWVLRFAFLICLVALPLVVATAIVQKTALRDELPSEVAPATGLQRWLTWRPVLITVVGSFALLAAGTVGYLGLRAGGIGSAASLITGGYIDEHSLLVLADFEGAGEAEALARTVNQGVRAEFLQSHVVTLAGPRDLGPILELMEKPPDAPLDHGTAREVAQRGGMPAVIQGEIVGGGIEGYIFTASIVSPESGEWLASHQVPTSGDPHEIMAAIDRLSKDLREEIGESYRDLGQSKPLPEVTTYSLEALQKYADSFEPADPSRVIPLLEEAVAIDSTFAMAWRRLGALTGNLWADPARAARAKERAFRYRERLPKRERYLVEGTHYRGEKAIEALETRLEEFPNDRDYDDFATRYNLGVTYRDAPDPVGRLDRAELVLREGLHRYPTHRLRCRMAVEYSRALFRLGKLDEVEEARREFCGGDRPMFWALSDAARGDYEKAEADLLRVAEDASDDIDQRTTALSTLAEVYATQGRLADAEAIAQEILAEPLYSNEPEAHFDLQTVRAGLQLRLKKDTLAAVATLELVLDPFRNGEIRPDSLPRILWDVAEVYARSGRVDEARELLSQLDSLGNPHVNEFPGAYPHLKGLLALREGHLEDALREFHASEVGGECPIICAAPGLAETFEAVGQADSALAAYESYITTPHEFRLRHWDMFFLAEALERAGQLAEQLGDPEQAAEYYSQFIELWAEADPELQPRVEAARRRLEELGIR